MEAVSNIITLTFLAVGVGVLWLGNELASDVPSPYNLLVIAGPVFLVYLAYVATQMFLHKRCSKLIRQYSSNFKVEPQFEGKVGEKLVDRLDIKIIQVIQDVGGRFSSFIPEMSGWLSPSELFRRLGRLHALGYVKTYKDKINITSSGLDLLALPPLSLQTNIPPEVAKSIAQNKMRLSTGQYKDVIVDISKALESLLRDALESSTGGDMEKLRGLNPKPYGKWTLGDLKGAASKIGVIDNTSGNILNSIVQLRNRSLHASRNHSELDADSAALTMMNLVEAFIRYWYSGQ